MKKLLLLLGLFFAIINSVFSQTESQIHQQNHKKYWYYRYRFNTHFTKIGTGRGESLCFSIRASTGSGNHRYLHMGDQTIHLGQYMAVLALEYNMLAQNNQNTDQTVKELWHLLYAFNRLDMTAESLFRNGADPGNYTGAVANLADLNGFFVRDDMNGDFFAENQAKFTDDRVESVASSIMDTAQSDFSYGELYYFNPSRMYWQDPSQPLLTELKKNNSIFAGWALCEESYDQVYRIMLGIAMIQKMVPMSVTYNGQAFQDGETSLKAEAKAILDRVILYANGKGAGSTSDWHHLRNPARTYEHPGQIDLFCNNQGNNCSNLNGDLVMRGNWSGYNWAVAEAAKSMTGNFNEVSPLYYFNLHSQH